MRSLIVELIEREEIIKEGKNVSVEEIIDAREVRGDNGWIDKYTEVVMNYTAKMMTNDSLSMRVKTIYN